MATAYFSSKAEDWPDGWELPDLEENAAEGDPYRTSIDEWREKGVADYKDYSQYKPEDFEIDKILKVIGEMHITPPSWEDQREKYRDYLLNTKQGLADAAYYQDLLDSPYNPEIMNRSSKVDSEAIKDIDYNVPGMEEFNKRNPNFKYGTNSANNAKVTKSEFRAFSMSLK